MIISNATKLKSQTKEQFTKTPCGSHYLKQNYLIVNNFFYKEAFDYRYKVYSPWLQTYILELCKKYNLKNKFFLEVGHGMGFDGLLFKKQGVDYTGIDLSSSHHIIAPKIFELNKVSGTFLISDCEKLKLKKESIDFVYSFGVLHHTPNIDSAIKHINFVLKPYGNFVFAVYAKYSFAYFLKVVLYYGIFKGYFLKYNASEIRSMVIEENSKNTKPYVKVYTKKEVVNLVEKNGFKVNKIFKKHLFRETRNVIVPKFMRRFLEKIGGWYIIVECKKIN